MPLVSHHGVLPQIHPSVFVAEGAYLIGEVTAGVDVSIWFNAVVRADINAIRIGDRTNIQDGSILHVTKEYMVEIGDDVTVGHQAMIHGCCIGAGTLIGMNAVILDNARVGRGCMVAAGSVVKQNFAVPDGTLAAGVPARIVRELTEEERALVLQSAINYVGYARSYVTP